MEQTLEFAGYQAGMAARMGVARMTQQERERLAALVEEMYIGLDDDAHISNSRWAVFSFLSERSRYVQHQVLINDASLALFRNLRGWNVPESDRERMLQVYRAFRVAVLHADADEAARLARQMHYV